MSPTERAGLQDAFSAAMLDTLDAAYPTGLDPNFPDFKTAFQDELEADLTIPSGTTVTLFDC